jgi:hypothetical protein
MQLPRTMMNPATVGPACDAAWAREWFLENCCSPAHTVIKEALAQVGFDVHRIEKHWFHDCWEVRMRCGTATLAPQHRLAARQIRHILADAGVYVERDAISLDRQGERVQVAFVYEGGEEGVWS